MTKPCNRCGTDDRYVDGQCRTCCKVNSAAYRLLNREKANAYSLAYGAANRERKREVSRAWNLANAEKRLQYEASPARRAQRAAKYAANTEKVKAAVSAWKKANPEAKLRENHNRRAKMLAVGGVLSKGLIAKLLQLQKGKCPCCRQSLGNDYHLDHKMPLALGGDNTDDNMQLLRSTCNLKKNSKHPVDFMQMRGFLL